jgi:hypothetical protein
LGPALGLWFGFCYMYLGVMLGASPLSFIMCSFFFSFFFGGGSNFLDINTNVWYAGGWKG